MSTGSILKSVHINTNEKATALADALEAAEIRKLISERKGNMSSLINTVIELQNIDGINAKLRFLESKKDDGDFKVLLYYLLDPRVTFNLSESSLRSDVESIKDVPSLMFEDILDCCDQLSRLRSMDSATLRQVKSFLYNVIDDEKAREVCIKLLAKTLRLGITAKTVNKAFEGWVFEWEVQQAYPIEKYPVKPGTEFWLTQKLNGVRATFYRGNLIARSGSVYKGLDHIINELNFITNIFDSDDLVLDGELTLLNCHGLSDNEAFRKSMGIINSDEENKTDICFTIFDAIPMSDFESSEPKVKYRTRRQALCVINDQLRDAKYIQVLPVLYHGSDQTNIDSLLQKMVNEDKEGLMLNTDVPYKRTRHKGILKIKRFYTMDLPIIRCEEGSGRNKGTFGAFVLDYKGNEVNVGSGFSDNQRQQFWENKENILGLLCEVKYKEISCDKKTDKESLQFPVFVRLREDKTEPSFG